MHCRNIGLPPLLRCAKAPSLPAVERVSLSFRCVSAVPGQDLVAERLRSRDLRKRFGAVMAER